MEIFKKFPGGNNFKLKKFFDDRQKVTTQFKALYGYGTSVSAEERKQFHQKNYRRAFSVCRTALDEYAKRGATANRKKETEDIKRPCEIMEALTRLCQDIPHLVKQNWNHNALSELFTKFLNFNTNEEIRLKCIVLIFVVLNAAKDSSHKKYIQCLKYSADYTPFCIQMPFENYYNNFKRNLIVAQEPLPWVRIGPTNKPHCMDILSALLSLVKDASDFDFWYLFLNKHIYSQLYHACTCANGALVQKLYDDQKHELDKPENVEKEGFGSVGPPPEIQSLLSEWICSLLRNQSKNRIILSQKLYILYTLQIMKNSMQLPVSCTMVTYNMLKRAEMWILGLNLTPKFKNEIQEYYQIIISHLFCLFELEMTQLTSHKLHKKINLVSYGIYLLRLISGEPYIKLSPATWQCLIHGMIAQIKYFQKYKNRNKQVKQIITEKLVHPLIHCLFKCFILMTISDSKTANTLLTQFRFEITGLIKYSPFVIQWREIIRNMTIELLSIISPKVEEKEKNYSFHSTSNTYKNIPSQNLDMDGEDYYFQIESRLQVLNIDIFEFRGLDEAFMIYDRLLHLLGSPVDNKHHHTRLIHLEGFCDSLKIFICALGIKEYSRARMQKIRAMKEKEMQMTGEEEHKSHHGQEISRLGQSIYGFAHSLISVPIDISGIALTGDVSESIRQNLPLPPREQLPQNDTLIEIFGAWLFDVCIDILCNCSLTEQVNRLSEFRMSFSCLSYIFLTHCEVVFDELYLSTYYKIIKLSFDSKISSRITSIVLNECCKGCIFGKNLHGVNCLIPDFLDVMCKIVGYNKDKKYQTHQTQNKVFVEQETNDILNIAMSLVCFAAHFDKIKISTLIVNDDTNKKNKSISFSHIKHTICDVFGYIALFDNLPVNIINTVIWTLVLIIYDEVSSSKNINIISAALQSIVSGTNINNKNMQMSLIATRAIESLSSICSEICTISLDLIIETLFEPFLVNTLDFVSAAGDRDQAAGKRSLICAICTHEIYCILEWMFRFPATVLCCNKIISLVFKVIHESLCLATKLPSKRSLHQHVNDKHPLGKLVLAAQTSKMMLFHYLGNFPLSHDSGAFSSNACDDYKGTHEGNVFVSYDSNVLITANDRILAHQAGPEPGVRLLLRDESGKFAWNFTPCSIQAKPMSSPSHSNKLILPHQLPPADKGDNDSLKLPKFDKRRPPDTSPPPPEHKKSEEGKNERDNFINSFNTNLSNIEEKHANISSKAHFDMKIGSDGLKQVLNYVSRELTPPVGKNNIKNINTEKNSGSFPNGHVSEKARTKLAKYMDEQKKEEHELYIYYEKLRSLRISKLKKLQFELAKEEEKKEDGGIKHALNDMKIREAVTGFDCSRFLLGHFGILTPGHVLGVKDSLFSDVTCDDISIAKYQNKVQKSKPMSPPASARHKHISLHAHANINTRHASMSQPSIKRKNANFHKRTSGKQYRLDPYLYSLDENLLAMFGNKDNAFHRRLRLLDQSSFEREKHKIGVVYVGPDQDEQKLILANEIGSVSYKRFMDKLGWTIDLLKHQGFNGAMNACTTGRYAKYYNTATCEIAFHIATCMPTNHNDPQQMEKKKHIGNDQVNIIYSDHGREYIVDTIYSYFNQVQIVIYPLNNGLFRIKIHKKKEVGDFGPLLNNMIIRQHLLSILVRITSLNANRTVRYASSVYTRPFVERKKYLDETIDKNSHKSHESMLGAFFPYMAK